MSATHLAKRFLLALLALAGLMVSIFFLVRLPRDPVDLYLPVDASQAARDAMRERLASTSPCCSSSSTGQPA